LYVCSVTPVNADLPTAQVETGVIKKKSLNDKIKQFNKLVKDKCTATYVDLYTYLADTQFSTIDGVRYSKETCLNILNYIDCYNSTGVTGFVPRTSAPVVTSGGTDKSGAYWLGDSYGGLNPFDDLGQSYAKCKGDTLPNCTAYAWGRFYEIIGSRPTLSTSNAEDWWGYTADGYERGQTPKLGAVICWSKGQVGAWHDDGAGHVAIVEQINPDGSIKCFIEYNGKQHYQATGGWNTEEQFKITQSRDNQKKVWCEKLNIPLYTIKYNEDIEQVIERIIKEVNNGDK
jgi:surface antigen